MKKSIAIFLAPLLFFASFLPFLETPLAPQKAYAEENCIYYIYDGQGNLRFVTDISGDLLRTLAETNSFNSITKSYVYGLGLISQGTTSVTSRDYYLEDGQGNIRFVTDEVGNKVRSTEYDPFGNWREAQGQANIHMLYQGQQQDPESSLYYLRARYYDPLLGRFISKDPVKGTLTNPQTQNPYSYAGNNPINRSDPSGKFWDYIPDAVFIGMDIANCDWGAAVVDTALGVLPGVPAVFGVTKRAGQAVNAVDNVVDAKRFTQDQSALVDLAKDAKRTGVSNEDANTLLQWADETGLKPALDHRGTQDAQHWTGKDPLGLPHIRIGSQNHIEVK